MTKDAGTLARPSSCEPHADEILRRYADGDTIRAIAEALVLSKSAVGRWISGETAGEQVAGQLAHARKAKAAGLIDEGLAILDAVDTESKFGSARVSKAREQAGFRRYVASCLDRQTWGEKVQVEHSGAVDHRIAVGIPLQAPAAQSIGPVELGSARLVAEAVTVEPTPADAVDDGDRGEDEPAPDDVPSA